MRWKIFQWMKFLFRHSSNSKKLSRQKFHNELACVFTVALRNRLKSTTTNGWRHFGHSKRRKSFVLFPIQSEKSPDSGFLTCDPRNKCIMPSSRERHKGLIGRGHDLRLGPCLLIFLSPRRVTPFLARSRFARSTIREENGDYS